MNRFLLFLLVLLPLSAFAQSSFKGNPLLSQMLNYDIIYNEEVYDAMEFPVSDVENTSISGQKTYIHCRFREGSRGVQPGVQQLLSQYYSVIRRLGGQGVFKGETFGTFKVFANQKEYWVAMQVHELGRDYTLAVIEREKLQEELNAERILAILKDQGHIAVYFTFSTGSSALDVEAMQNINEIVKLMNIAPDLKLSIEGHTDNEGAAQNNKELSLERAQAVTSALVEKGVERNRLRSVGWGQEKPIADNSTPEGRVKNRRVELVRIR